MRLRWFSRHSQGAKTQPPAAPPPAFTADAIAPFLRSHLGLPHLNWEQAINHFEASTSTESEADDMAIGMIAAWVDALAEAMQAKHKAPLDRWRTEGVEGLAPSADLERLKRATTSALTTIGRALAPIRGEPDEHPIAHITVIAAPTLDAYYDLVDEYGQHDGHFASSGGMHLGSSPNNPSTLILNVHRHAFEHSLAHELTHHALAPQTEDAGYLPLWAEEGLTQLMEERVTNQSYFTFDQEKLQRHRALWSSIGLDGFLNGDTFRSPEDGHQELSYNLAEAVTRSLLDAKPDGFFAFARACLSGGDPAKASVEHLGQTEADVVLGFLGIDAHK